MPQQSSKARLTKEGDSEQISARFKSVIEVAESGRGSTVPERGSYGS
jgi:hypothetical protein